MDPEDGGSDNQLKAILIQYVIKLHAQKMPGNTLVLKIYQQLGRSEYQYIYIFYDHDVEAYGIRGCRYNAEYDHENKYSLFCAGDSALQSFLKFTLNYDGNTNFISMNLLNYPNLSMYSDNITYDSLSEHTYDGNKFIIDGGYRSEEDDKTLPHEIMGYVFTGKQDQCDFRGEIEVLMDILKNSWD